MNFPKLFRPARILIVLCIVISPLLPLLAAHAPAQEAVETNQALLEQQKKIHRLKKGIEDQKSRVKDVRDKEVNLLDELEKIELRLDKDREQLAELKNAIGAQEEKIQQKQQEVEEAQQERDAASGHIKKRLSAYYKMDPFGVMNVVFSADSLPDLLNFREYFQCLLNYDQQAIRAYRKKIESLQQATAACQAEKKELVTVITRVKVQEEQLAETRQEKLTLLAHIKTEKKLYQLALEELEEASDNLTKTFNRLKKEAQKIDKPKPAPAKETTKKKRPKGLGFAGLKGKLTPPVTGSVTKNFGKNAQGKFGIATVAKGIDIRTAPGTEIRAIFDGKVAYAGTLRGYGNLLIIDHGDQYYSLLSRAEKFYKKEGDPVSENEVIGVMTEQEGLLADGLHFEIRHGTEPENPLHWVNNADLVIKAGSME